MSQNKIVRKQNSKGKNNNKVVVENVRTEYVTKNGSVFLNKTDEIMKNGDLNVDNIHSFYLGRHIIRNGDRPQKIMRAYDPMSEFYFLNRNIFQRSKIFVDENVTMGGCFKSNKVTIQRTMIPDIDVEMSGLPSMGKIKFFKKAVRSAIRKLKIQQLAKCFKSDMELTSFNAKTYPGFSYSEYYNLKKKEEAASMAFNVANKRWENIDLAYKNKNKLRRNNLFPSTFVVGARNKREYDFEDDEILSSRAVHMPEFHSEINSSIWIEQITNSIRERESGPIYIGNSFVKYERLLKDTFASDDIVEGDWKRFDSRLYITNIIIGIALLRLYYDHNDRNIDYHFIAMFDSIGIKDYYTPGGHLYRIVHGLPSGICSTSLLGSIINFVNLLQCSKDFSHKKLKYIVGGDDFLVVLDRSLDVGKVIERMKVNAEEIGQVFKFLDQKSFKNKNVLEKPCFFKYTIDRNEPIVFPPALLERTFLPWNKNYGSNVKIYNFLKDQFPSLAAPRSFHLPFYYFYKSIYEKVFKRKILISEIFKEHNDIYRKVMAGKKYFREERLIYFKNFYIVNEKVLHSEFKIKHFWTKRRSPKIELKIKRI